MHERHEEVDATFLTIGNAGMVGFGWLLPSYGCETNIEKNLLSTALNC